MGDDSRTDEHVVHALRFIEFAERHEKRRRRTVWFNRRQCRISFERRQWLGITEMADEYAKEPGSLEVNAERRNRFINSVRRSILSGEFTHNGRSQVLNVHPSGLAENRFDPIGASNEEQFNPIVAYLYISRTQWSNWLERHGVEIPRFPATSVKAAREAPSLPAAEDNPQEANLGGRPAAEILPPPTPRPRASRRRRNQGGGTQTIRARAVLKKMCPQGYPTEEHESSVDLYERFTKEYEEYKKDEAEAGRRSRFPIPSKSVVMREVGRKMK
jgi:hypothetical protein